MSGAEHTRDLSCPLDLNGMTLTIRDGEQEEVMAFLLGHGSRHRRIEPSARQHNGLHAYAPSSAGERRGGDRHGSRCCHGESDLNRVESAPYSVSGYTDAAQDPENSLHYNSRSSSFEIFSSNSCLVWHSTHSFANGTAASRFSLISIPHSAQIPYRPSARRANASSIDCRFRFRISSSEIPSSRWRSMSA